MSENWSAGYVTGLEYTHGFYRELAPAHLRFAALSSGFRSYTDNTDAMTYCELGCGQGVTANILAAANPEIEVYATDFNPAHVYNGQRLADAASLSNMHFFDDSFAEFEQRNDLPQFNIITLHGIYSWIAKEHRDTIVRFIDKRLKPGGLVYISYNCLPGWAAPAPIQHLIQMHAEKGAGLLTERVDNALIFLENLQEEGARYFKAAPGVGERIKNLKTKSKNYLVHEYLNREWNPFYQSQVVSELSSARLSYIGTADILQQIDDINLTPAQQTILKETKDGVLRETIRDYIVNRQFRKDIFARGALPLSTQEFRDEWLNTRFALLARSENVPMTAKAILGEVTLQETAYRPVINAFEDAGGHALLRDIVKDPAVAQLGWARLQRILRTLVGNGAMHPCPSGTPDNEKRKECTARLNRAIIKQAPYSDILQCLASPVTGNGVAVSRLSQMFLLSMEEEEKNRAAFAWNLLKKQGQTLGKDGKILATDEENTAVLKERYDIFLQKYLPVLQQLGIA